LSQQKIATQAEALEIVMRLQSLKKGKEAQLEVRTKVLCLKFKAHGHDKDHCPIYKNYLIGGGPVPLKPENTIGLSAPPWCNICQVTGYANTRMTENYSGKDDPCDHLARWTKAWETKLQLEWVHIFCHTLDTIPIN